MTPNHKTDTLEGLIERWRWAASLGKVTKDPAIAAQQAGWAQCADELAPILAGLREFRDEWVIDGTLRDRLDKWLGQPATADQTGVKALTRRRRGART